MLSDVRLSLRWLRRSPTLAAAAVCTLAVAIGASVAVFAVVDKVLIRPLPIRDEHRVVVIWPRERNTPATIGEVSYATFRAWQRDARGFEQLAAIGSTTWGLVLQEGEPATIPAAAVSASFFPLAGATAAIGRTLQPEDDRKGSARVAVLSHGAWQRRFGGDPAIVGRPLRFRDGVYTVVGVMPDGFDYPRGADLWVALVPQLETASQQWNVDVIEDPGFGVLFVLGRLAPGVTIDAASATVSNLIARGVPAAFRPGMEASLTPIAEHIFGSTRAALVAVTLCVGLVLLIACSNASALLLVRAASRSHEAAARIALGASRWRLLRQSLADAAVLATAGGTFGVALAYWTVKALLVMAPARVPRIELVRFDGRTLAGAAVVSILVALFVGVAPGLQASSHHLAAALTGVGTRVTRARRMRRAFAVAQVGLALALLVCAGLVGRSFLNLLRIDVGFDPTRVLTMDVQLPDATRTRHDGFYTALLERVRAMPGVESAGAIYQRPLEYSGIGMDGSVLIEGQRTDVESGDWEKNPRVNLESVTPGYFDAIGAPVVRGRAFLESDTATTPRVAVVGEALARRLWPGQQPIGKRLNTPGALPDVARESRWATVVGVVRDARYRGLTDPRFDLYLAHAQSDLRVKHLMVRASTADAAALAGAVRAEARRLDASVLVEGVAGMESLVRQATAPWRFSATTLGVLAAVALALAALGVYATVSQTVVERTREIAIRVAVGAVPAQIGAMVLREGLWLAAAGVVAGAGVAAVAARAITGLLFGVAPLDPLTTAAAALLFLAVSVAALSLPAWRAAHVEPRISLKQQ
jgi:putative ABC transport system permease protein